MGRVKKEKEQKQASIVNAGGLLLNTDGLFNIDEQQQKRQDVSPKMRYTRGLQHAMQEGYKHNVGGVQLTIFNELEAKTQDKIRSLNVDSSSLYFGIDLDGDGWEIIEVLQLLLYKHSNTTDQSRADYYRGDPNTTALQTLEWNGREQAVGYIETTLAELAKLRTGLQKVGGKDLKTTKTILMKYTDKRYLLRYREDYTETKPNGKTKRSWRTIEGYTMLYHASVAQDAGTRTNLVKVWLSPAFNYQIARNYDEKPLDFLDRVRKTYADVTGSQRKQLPNYLLAFLNQLIDAQHYDGCIYHCKTLGKGRDKGIYEKLNNSWVKARRWADLETAMAQYIEVATRIGLLRNHWKETNISTGEDILYFEVTPAKEWQ